MARIIFAIKWAEAIFRAKCDANQTKFNAA